MQPYRIDSVRIREESDVILTREKARAVARALGIAADDVSRLTTACVEVAKAALSRGGGEVVLSVVEDDRLSLKMSFRTALRLTVSPEGSWDPVRAASLLCHDYDQRSARDVHELNLIQHAPWGGDARARIAAARAAVAPGELERRIEELERQNGELQRALEQAEGLGHRKDEMMATVAHDLRSPLAAIKGALDLMTSGAAGALGPDQQRYLDIAEHATEHVLSLVSDLLDSSLLSVGKLGLETAPLALAPIIEELGETHALLARGKGIAFTTEIADGLPAVLADRHRLAQVLANLMANAVKFTDAGGNIRVSAQPSGPRLVAVEVADSGIGMPPARLRELWATPRQPQSRGTRGERGTGLGLYICRRLVELHGGTLDVRSRLGEGTTFRFTLPCARSGPA